MITEKKYKKITDCTVKQARIAIAYFNFIEKKRKKASICPECGGRLYFEIGSYEEGYSDYIGCLDCDFTADVEGGYEVLFPYYDFDPILCAPKMFSPKERKKMMQELTEERLQEMKASRFAIKNVTECLQ